MTTHGFNQKIEHVWADDCGHTYIRRITTDFAGFQNTLHRRMENLQMEEGR